MAKSQNMSDNPLFNAAFEKAAFLSSTVAQTACKLAATMPEAICLALASAVGAIGVASELVQHEDSKTPSGDVVLFACLLLANVTAPIKGTADAVFSFDPSVVNDTMDMFERVTGRKPDKLLLSHMVSAARDMASDGNKPLAAFMAARPHSPLQ